MMKRSFILFAVVLILTLGTSCATKQTAINRMERFSVELRENSQDYTLAEWKQAANRFVELRKQMAKYDYTPEQRKQIGQLEGRCLRYMAEGAKNGLLNRALGLGGELNGILDEILNLNP